MQRSLPLVALTFPLAVGAAAPTGPDGSYPRRVAAGGVSSEIRPGSTCDGIGPRIPLSDDLGVKQRGTALVMPFVTGCGCATGPVFTLLFEPRTSPLEVRLCAGPGTDVCERGCSGELVWDLSDALAAAGATHIADAD